MNPKKYVGASVLGPSPRAKYKKELLEAFDWVQKKPCTEFTIRSNDGLNLHARLLKSPNPVGCVMLFHGFRSSPERDFNIMIPFLYENNYSLLLVDVRAHGKSGGRYMTYGVKEGEDCALWANELSKRFPALPLFAFGTSMGAATVMFASDKPLANVKGIIADCGFTSPWDVLAFSWRRKMRTSPKLIMPFISIWIRLLCGYNPKRRTADRLKNTKVPCFFIHGKTDATIPYAMTVENSGACAAWHKLLLVENGEHCTNFIVANEEYCQELLSFLKRYEHES
ncbi:MAG: alpha/beta hydrolase [Clostridia bacterium]|nr:alpha/beta hydrolase [Clostridia bacterium]